MVNLNTVSYGMLQKMAKKVGIKANQKAEKLRASLRPHAHIFVDETQDETSVTSSHIDQSVAGSSEGRTSSASNSSLKENVPPPGYVAGQVPQDMSGGDLSADMWMDEDVVVNNTLSGVRQPADLTSDLSVITEDDSAEGGHEKDAENDLNITFELDKTSDETGANKMTEKPITSMQPGVMSTPQVLDNLRKTVDEVVVERKVSKKEKNAAPETTVALPAPTHSTASKKKPFATPNFSRIHARHFAKMESLVDYSNRKASAKKVVANKIGQSPSLGAGNRSLRDRAILQSIERRPLASKETAASKVITPAKSMLNVTDSSRTSVGRSSATKSKPVFDLKASLDRPITWQRHKGPLKPFDQSEVRPKVGTSREKVDPKSAALPSLTRIRDSLRAAKDKQSKENRQNTVMARRNIDATS